MNNPTKDFISDADMNKMQSSTPDFIPDEKIKEIAAKNPSFYDKASDFWHSFQEGLPMAGLVDKAATAAAAKVYSLGSEKSYDQIHNEMSAADKSEKTAREERSPALTTAGNIAGSFVVPNPGSIIGRVGLNVADAATRADSADELVHNVKTAGVISAGAESLPYVGKLFKAGGEGLSSSAEKLAEKATGATGKQSEKFAENAGRELLDQGVVKAFYSPKNIAGKAGEQLEYSYKQIDKSLDALDQAGAFVSKDDVVGALQKELDKLPKGPSSSDARASLGKEIEKTQAGPDKYSLAEAELEKRTYQHQSNYNQDEEVKDIKRKTARAWRTVVEDKATAIDPQIAEAFKTEKQRYAIFAPIETAAAKRAQQLSQSPFGGLIDWTSIGAGLGGSVVAHNPSGVLYGVGLAALRRGLAPRIASTAAVATDALGRGLTSVGNNASLSLPMQMAITRGLTYPGQNQGLQLPRK